MDCAAFILTNVLIQAQNYPSVRPFDQDATVVSQESGALGAPDVMLHGLVIFLVVPRVLF